MLTVNKIAKKDKKFESDALQYIDIKMFLNVCFTMIKKKKTLVIYKEKILETLGLSSIPFLEIRSPLAQYFLVQYFHFPDCGFPNPDA